MTEPPESRKEPPAEDHADEPQGEPRRDDVLARWLPIGAIRARWSELPRVNINDIAEKIAFIIALVAGVTIIGIGKGLELGPAWLITTLACIIIVAYAAFSSLTRERRVRLDRAGDNCYYLGLTFTLASMAIALAKLRPGVSPEDLIGPFAVALWSTIAGIAARLVLIQFRTEADDAEEHARIELAKAADHLKLQLTSAASQFQSFSISIQEAVRSSIVSLTDDQLGKQKQLISDFSSVLERSVTAITQATVGVEASLTRHVTVMDSFDHAAQRSVEAAQVLAEKVKAVAIPDDLLTRGFADIAAEVQGAATSVKEALDEIRKSGSVLSDASSQLTTFAAKSSEATSGFSAFTTATSTLASSMSKMVGELERGANQLGQQNTALDTELTRLKSLSLQYAGSLAQVAEFLTKEIGRANK